MSVLISVYTGILKCIITDPLNNKKLNTLLLFKTYIGTSNSPNTYIVIKA